MKAKKYRLLVVDDEPVIRKVLCQKLTAEGYRCREAGDAEEALVKLAQNGVELVILDIKMPGRSGADLLPDIKRKYPDTAVIMATAVVDTATAIHCLREGADDYLVKPFNLDEVVLSAERALEKRRLELENRAYQQRLEEMVAERTAALELALDKVKLASLDTIHRLAQAAEYKDEDTGAHIKRMSQYSAIISRKMGLGDREVENTLYAAPMHDIGKIGVPDHILFKPGKLDPDEWEIMKKHTVVGAKILQGSDAEFIRLAEVIALTHHEKWDGSGYPAGLRGTEIPLVGRIVAIADVFDALTSKRPYKEAFSLEKSLGIIRQGRGSHFDPEVVDAFFSVEEEILAIRDRYRDEQADMFASQLSFLGVGPN